MWRHSRQAAHVDDERIDTTAGLLPVGSLEVVNSNEISIPLILVIGRSWFPVGQLSSPEAYSEVDIPFV